ncbi:MAG: L-serine ammonia-lyase, iron-sulfur-dependent, subunit alpha [Anaerovoracaceae bacterium]
MKSKPISIFNEVLGPIMRGTSSSHTAAAYMIGLIARKLFNRPINKVLVSFSTRGSLPTTFKSQGSEIGLTAGLFGLNLKSEEIKDIVQLAKDSGLVIEVIVNDDECNHPNIYNLTLYSRDLDSMRIIGISTGGGMVKIIKVNDIDTDIEGDTFENISGIGSLSPILPIPFTNNSYVPFNNAWEFEQIISKRKFWEHAIEYEACRGNMEVEQVWNVAEEVLSVMRGSLNTGLAGTDYKDRILGQQFHLIDQALEKKLLIDSPLINRIEKYVMAIMECKSSFGLIVAAPTAGSCAVIPASILACCDLFGFSKEQSIKALLSAGLIGAFIAKDSTFSAEVAGCQAECGAASGMAAAAIVELMNGSIHQTLDAASFALQNTFGMVCDPIANRVEAPCLGKNIMCAMNAISSANMALAGAEPLIPLSQVITAMDKVGKSIASELRCTGLGGLSICKASLELQKSISDV